MFTLRFARKGRSTVKTEWISEDPSLRHLDLSFVGESIMYPEINLLIDELYHKADSYPFVTSAQFPEKIRELQSVTQFYISINATTKDN